MIPSGDGSAHATPGHDPQAYLREFFVEPTVLKAIYGGSLFYPGAGDDWYQPLAVFGHVLDDFWFVDKVYFTRRGADREAPLDLAALGFEYVEGSIEGPPLATGERRIDSVSGREYPHIDPCTRTDQYRHSTSGRMVRVHRRRGYGQRSIALLEKIGVFWHRADSPGEGGSNVSWLAREPNRDLRPRLEEGSLVVSDGSLSTLEALLRAGGEASSHAAFQAAQPFQAWGLRWTPVGWADKRRHPTVVWRVGRQTADLSR